MTFKATSIDDIVLYQSNESEIFPPLGPELNENLTIKSFYNAVGVGVGVGVGRDSGEKNFRFTIGNASVMNKLLVKTSTSVPQLLTE